MARKRKRSAKISGSLFAAATPEDGFRPPVSGFLATNHLNLEYMLAAGLIMPPSGFAGKHYQDTLANFPGWIPLFPYNIATGALECSVAEESYLIPCIAQVRMDLVGGRAMVLRGGALEEIDFPDDAHRVDDAYLFPAPFPVHWIQRILFRTQAEKKAFDASARELRNVPFRAFARKVDKKRFAGRGGNAWPPRSKVPEIEARLAEPQAAAGIAAMLMHVANHGDRSVRASRIAFDPREEESASLQIPVLENLASWQRDGRSDAAVPTRELSSDGAAVNSAQAQIFWGAVDRLASWNASRSPGAAVDVVHGCLVESAQDLPGPLKRMFLDFASALRSFAGFGNLTVSQVLEQFPTPFSRAMTLFFHVGTCADLLEFEHPLLEEADRIVAAVLFGARHGWQDLPSDLREVPDGLSQAVTHRMAAMTHRLAGTGIDLGNPPPRCRPLRELFTSGAKWRARQRRAALLLARKSGWDCIETVVRLGGGTYELRIGRGGLQIVFKGEPRAVGVEVHPERFFKCLPHARIEGKLDAEVRKGLG